MIIISVALDNSICPCKKLQTLPRFGGYLTDEAHGTQAWLIFFR
jgi:hypothetical protein